MNLGVLSWCRSVQSCRRYMVKTWMRTLQKTTKTMKRTMMMSTMTKKRTVIMPVMMAVEVADVPHL